MPTADLPCQRDRFSLPEGAHYLNCAYMSPLLKRAEEAGIRGIRRKRFPAEIAPEDFFRDADRARSLFARLIGSAEPGRVAILPAVSYGISAAVRNLEVSPGQNVVLAAEQFPSNVLPWRRLRDETGVSIRTIEADGAPRGAQLNERLLEAIDGDTAAVGLGPVHWTDGTRLDLEAIGGRAREVGSALIVDGTQSVGAAPFDVEAVRPDALICAAYKWLLGPYSIGVGWYGPRFDQGRPLEETWLAREDSDDFQNLVHYRDAYRPLASRYDVGGRSNFILLPMLNAGLEQLLEWGVESVRDYCGRLADALIPGLRERGFGVEEDRWRSPHIFGLRVPAGLAMERVRDELARRGIHVSLRGSAVRVSPNVYNDASDMEALGSALASLVG